MEEMFWEGAHRGFLRTHGSRDTITPNEGPDREKGRAGDTGGIAHFGFRLTDEADLEQAIEEVHAAGGTLLGQGEDSLGEPFAYVTDPDGCTIEL